MMICLNCGTTHSFLLEGRDGYLLVDTGMPGTLPAFYKALKAADVRVRDIAWILATHYHPDHIGLIPDLLSEGGRLLLTQTQTDFVHRSDPIFARDPKLRWKPIETAGAFVLPCAGSRAFLRDLGIGGEIVSTPSHSPDSISLLTDGGDCLVGDLERRSVLPAYEADAPAALDWKRILALHPKRIYYAHGPAEDLRP